MDVKVVERIKRFAMHRAGLSEEELQEVLQHDCEICNCDLCRKFDVYLSVKRMLEQYEARMPDV